MSLTRMMIYTYYFVLYQYLILLKLTKQKNGDLPVPGLAGCPVGRGE